MTDRLTADEIFFEALDRTGAERDVDWPCVAERVVSRSQAIPVSPPLRPPAEP